MISQTLFRNVITGSIIKSICKEPPEGYLRCKGDVVSKSEYTELFSIIGYFYGGSGDLFNLPNLTNKKGAGFVRGCSEGSPVRTISPSSIKNHRHVVHLKMGGAHNHGFPHDSVSSTVVDHGLYGSYRNFLQYPSEDPKYPGYAIPNATTEYGGQHSHKIEVKAYGDTSQTAPESMAVNYFIKY